MANKNQDYVEQMRADGVSDADIKKSLAANGWEQSEINALFTDTKSGRPVPPPPHKSSEPIAVVQRYSTRGMEYSIMFISLFFGAVSLGIFLHDLLDRYTLASPQNGTFLDDATLPAVMAIVTLPIFVLLYIRLSRVEKSNPAVHNDSSRRHGVQLALIISFIWGIVTLVGYLYQLLTSLSGTVTPDTAVVAGTNYQLIQFMHLLITLAIAGGIFAYYWIDEHKQTT